MYQMQAYPSSVEQIGSCIQIMQNAMVPRFSIICSMKDFYKMTLPGKLSEEFMEYSKALYPDNQLRRYRMHIKSSALYSQAVMDFDMEYMATQKETNDLRCFCGAFGNRLCGASLSTVLNSIHQYFCRQYTYKNTGEVHDHSSASLLRTGGGVCQAIAVLAATILQFTKYGGLNVTGEGFNGKSWGPHMWNAVKMDSGKWIFVDFTFGLNNILSLPSTMTPASEERFWQTHRYDKKAFSQETLNKALKEAKKIGSAQLSLGINKGSFFINGEQFSIDNGTPMLGKSDDGTFWIDLRSIVNMLGGSLERIPGRDILSMYVPNKTLRYYAKNSLAYLLNGQVFDVRILNQLRIPYYFDGSMFKLEFDH